MKLLRRIGMVLVVLLVGLIGASSIVGCSKAHPITYYVIGTSYEFDYATVTVTHDVENDQFIFEWSNNGYADVVEFDFTFEGDNIYLSNNSPEFKYIDHLGHEIVFYKNVCYTSTEDVTMYISYQDVTEEVKAVIDGGRFSLYFEGFGSFVPLN